MEATIKSTFTDDQGNSWEYCDGVCNLELKALGKTDERRSEFIRAPVEPDGYLCHCVIFQVGIIDEPKLIAADGEWVKKEPGAEYLCRCVKQV